MPPMSECYGYDVAPIPPLFPLDDFPMQNDKMHSNLPPPYSSDPMSNYEGLVPASLSRDGFSTQVVENNKTHSNPPSPWSSDLTPNYDGPVPALSSRDGFSTQVVKNDKTHSNSPSPYLSDLSYVTFHGHAGVTLAPQRQAYDNSYSPAWIDGNSSAPYHSSEHFGSYTGSSGSSEGPYTPPNDAPMNHFLNNAPLFHYDNTGANGWVPR
jgi:hypothetical protein